MKCFCSKSLVFDIFFKGDQKLGINSKFLYGIVYCPGFLELSSCYLRLALTTKHALKRPCGSVVSPPRYRTTSLPSSAILFNKYIVSRPLPFCICIYFILFFWFLIKCGSLICNWSDRTAACALAMSISGVFLSTLLKDLMLQTSVAHVADVIGLF